MSEQLTQGPERVNGFPEEVAHDLDGTFGREAALEIAVNQMRGWQEVIYTLNRGKPGDLGFAISMALMKAGFSEKERDRAARMVREQLEMGGWKIDKPV